MTNTPARDDCVIDRASGTRRGGPAVEVSKRRPAMDQGAAMRYTRPKVTYSQSYFDWTRGDPVRTDPESMDLARQLLRVVGDTECPNGAWTFPGDNGRPPKLEGLSRWEGPNEWEVKFG